MANYITADMFRSRHGITINSNEARIAEHVAAASREVDAICHRRFDADSTATARTYQPTTADLCYIDDALQITEVAVDEQGDGTYVVWSATTDYVTDPPNGIGPNGQAGWPATALRAVNSTFPTRWRTGGRPRSVRVTAKWGWIAVPADVVEACYLLAHRLYYEVAVPSGLTSPNLDFGLPGSPLQRPWTPERLLAPYNRQVSDRRFGVA